MENNGTYQNDTDREAIQLEVDALKSEIDRISTATEYNGMQLLDGSLSGAGGNTNEYGAVYGLVTAADPATIGGGKTTITANAAGIKVAFTVGASGKGGENAVWEKDGKTVTVNLQSGVAYTDEQIQSLIDNATVPKDATAPNATQVTFKSEYGVITGAAKVLGPTAAGVRDVGTGDLKTLVGKAGGAIGSADTIKLTANTYGATADNATSASKITIVTDVGAGKENLEATTTAGEYVLHLSTGVNYTEKDIENLLNKGGLDYTVELTDTADPDGSNDGSVFFNVSDATGVDVSPTGGTGVGKSGVPSSGTGLVFQIGANGVEDQRVTLNVDNMGADALGVASADVSTRDAANKAINSVDAAIKKVSMQRAGLGALQNRLEYTVNNLTTTNENLTNAESQIRDTDMATEMINYTKFNILQQASQAMLAQANQQPQAVLQLLG